MRGLAQEAADALDAAFDWCSRSREVELTLEAQLLDLALARASSDEKRAEQVAGTLFDAAVAGGYGSILARIDDRA